MVRRGERGQATVEWVGLVLLVSLALVAALALAGARLPGGDLARAIAARIACAISFDKACGRDPELVAAYGLEVATLAADHVPELVYELGERQLPVDFRSCREVECALGPETGSISRTAAGLPAIAFVHVVDCRPGSLAAAREAGYDCAGDCGGNLYIQYWFYYPDSSTLEQLPGDIGYHRDDWESYGVRIGPGGTQARASSHHGYNHTKSRANWGADAGIGPLKDAAEAVGLRERNGWGPATTRLYVSAGSHAGNAAERHLAQPQRWTPPSRLRLLPIEPVAAEQSETPFAVSPPWRKAVYNDPEAEGT
jgi:hypothetical protein